MDDASEELKHLYMAIGYLTLNWAQAEIALDVYVATIFHEYGGSKLIGELPVSLTKKLDFARKAHNQLPKVAGFKSRAAPLLRTFKTLASTRNDFIHGALTDLKPDQGKFRFTITDRVKNELIARDFHFDAIHFPSYIKSIQDLAANMSDLASDALEMSPTAERARQMRRSQ